MNQNLFPEDVLPEELDVSNKDTFGRLYSSYKLTEFRKAIYEYMISREDENEYFSLDQWCRINLKNNTKLMNEFTQIIMLDLHELCWRTKLSFGETGLFVYSTEKPPPSCYEDGL